MRRLCLLLAGSIVPSCGSSENDDAASDTGSGGSTGAEMGSAADDPSASTSPSATGTDGPTGATTDSATTNGGTAADSGSGDGDTTSGVDPCVGLTRSECNADPTCAAITCSLVELNGGARACIGDSEYLDCHLAHGACDDVRTYACMGDDGPIYLCPTSCIPAGMTECEAPAEMIPTC